MLQRAVCTKGVGTVLHTAQDPYVLPHIVTKLHWLGVRLIDMLFWLCMALLAAGLKCNMFLNSLGQMLFFHHHAGGLINWGGCASVMVALHACNGVYSPLWSGTACWSDEDFIGRISRTNRKVHATSVTCAFQTLKKCLIQYRTEWQKAILSGDPCS